MTVSAESFKSVDFTAQGAFQGSVAIEVEDGDTGTYSGQGSGTGTVHFTSPFEGTGTGTGSADGVAHMTPADGGDAYDFPFSGTLDIAGTYDHGAIVDLVFDTPFLLTPPTVTATFDVEEFRAQATWQNALIEGPLAPLRLISGSWEGEVVTLPQDAPRDLYLSSASWDGSQVSFSYAFDGPPIQTTAHGTPVSDVRLFWSTSATAGGILAEIPVGSAPIYWNQSTGTATADNLGAVPAQATHLLIAVDQNGRIDESNEANNLVAFDLSQPTPIDWPPAAKTLYVDADAADGGDGYRWDTAFKDLQAALSLAQTTRGDDGDTENDVEAIWIAEGEYRPSALLDDGDARSAVFSLVDGVALYGGFAGNETTLDARNWLTNVTTLSGDLGTLGVASDNAYTVVYCGENVETVVDGLSITGAASNESDGLVDTGGGIHNRGTLTVKNSILSGNSAVMGGAIFSSGASLLVADSTVTENTAAYYGGGLYAPGASVTIVDSDLSGNTAQLGGAIFASDNADLKVLDSTISGNSAPDGGGGIWADDDSGPSNIVVIRTSILSNASSNSEQAVGGGIAFLCLEGTLTISASVLSANFAALLGGGVYANGTVTITGSTVAGNTSETGGGVYGPPVAYLNNTIIAGNSAVSVPDIQPSACLGSNNLIGVGDGITGLTDGIDGNQVGTTASPLDPLFVDVQTYADIVGADQILGTADDGPLGDYHLLESSTAIDAGSGLFLDETDTDGLGPDAQIDLDGSGFIGDCEITTDFDGAPRIHGKSVDIGAFEYSTTDVKPVVLGTIDFFETSGLAVNQGAIWYQFTTARAGSLSVMTAAVAGSADSALYDSSQTEPPLAVSDTVTGRFDYPVQSGETYLLKISGSAADAALTIANLVATQGTEIQVFGTENADTFQFAPTGSYVITINGFEYHFDDTQFQTIVFAGSEGDDTAALTGGPDTEIARFFPDHGTFSGNGFLVTITDVVGITAHGGGGPDEAYLYDSPGADTFVSRKGYGNLSGEGYTLETFDFMFNYGYAMTEDGGSDFASMEDTPGADKFKLDWSSPDQFFGKMYGGGVYCNRAKNFEVIEAGMTDGNDTVRLYDSEGDETFYGQRDESRLIGNGFDVTVSGYDTLTAFASNGFDAAYLDDSAEDDSLRARPHKLSMWGGEDANPTYQIVARKFDQYHIEAIHGGLDRAKLHDTALADHVHAEGGTASLARNDGELDPLYEVVAFEWVRLYGTDNGSHDTIAKQDPLQFDLVYDALIWEML